jgi:hypothetical protein
MNFSRSALLALCIVLPWAPSGAFAQANHFAQANQWDKPVDLKPLVPPVVPLPPSSRLNPGTVGGSPTPYTTAPLQNPNLSPADPAPGLRLTIPSH